MGMLMRRGRNKQDKLSKLQEMRKAYKQEKDPQKRKNLGKALHAAGSDKLRNKKAKKEEAPKDSDGAVSKAKS